MEIINELLKLKDQKYAEFQSKLIPSISKERIIGVRIPDIRQMGKKYAKEDESKEFLKELPHFYLEENILHAQIISEIKDLKTCFEEIDRFLPYVDNWAVCDTMSPKVLKKDKIELLKMIRKWANSNKTYTCRFGIGMLMRYFLDEDFQKELLEIPANVHSEEYYVNMMVAWFFATALAKQYDDVIIYLQNNRLNKWIHNKTIQKACESYRITPEQKEYLKKIRR